MKQKTELEAKRKKEREVAVNHQTVFRDRPGGNVPWCLLHMTLGSEGNLACYLRALVPFLTTACLYLCKDLRSLEGVQGCSLKDVTTREV